MKMDKVMVYAKKKAHIRENMQALLAESIIA